ncbi:MAG: hypothetical protein CVU71_07115 [Deltaproteobacteria bacterium HGW-Deltaproteobacteria-6]|jgi:hypothetical protein|nr:MAG: hypothetical protein CVU71_07115 [Deltaproteobacteria bacterium HGW-Deltaproteobacteria-6]
MSVNNLPEYHELFQGGDGNVTLKVRFANRQEIKGRSFPPKKIHWQDVQRLFDGPNRMPYEKMNFDEWPFIVKKIEIEPAKEQVTLVITE